MPEIKNNTLLISNKQSQDFPFEFDFYSVDQKNKSFAINPNYPVIVLVTDALEYESLKALFTFFSQLPTNSKIICIGKLPNSSQIKELYNLQAFCKWLNNFENIQQEIQYALNKFNLEEQDRQLEKMVHFQKEKLENLKQNLEDRVQLRQSNLIKTRKRLENTFLRVESLHRALIAVHQANSKIEMEQFLLKAINTGIAIEKIEIFENKTQIQMNKSFLDIRLLHDKQCIGIVRFYFKVNFALNRSEKNFLYQITDTIALALERLKQLNQSVALENQWVSTFNAISQPVAIIDSNFQIVQGNMALQHFLRENNSNIQSNKTCYKVLFQKDKKCQNCRLGNSFLIENKQNNDMKQYQVFSQVLEQDNKNERQFIHIYRDITEKNKTEKQLLESAKMVEMGTVGSSIAHELNNPLAGILSFLQLISLDLDQKSKISEDIKAMENAAIRCKEIIQNLLSFTRKTNSEKSDKIQLQHIIQRVVHITNLQAKSLGIQINTTCEIENSPLQADFNLLSQALMCVLQNSMEAIIEKMKQSPKYPGEIQIRLTLENCKYIISINDNGIGIKQNDIAKLFTPLYSTKNPKTNRGLGLSICYKILRDLKGEIEIFSKTENGVQVRISLPAKITVS